MALGGACQCTPHGMPGASCPAGNAVCLQPTSGVYPGWSARNRTSWHPACRLGHLPMAEATPASKAGLRSDMMPWCVACRLLLKPVTYALLLQGPGTFHMEELA